MCCVCFLKLAMAFRAFGVNKQTNTEDRCEWLLSVEDAAAVVAAVFCTILFIFDIHCNALHCGLTSTLQSMKFVTSLISLLHLLPFSLSLSFMFAFFFFSACRFSMLFLYVFSIPVSTKLFLSVPPSSSPSSPPPPSSIFSLLLPL